VSSSSLFFFTGVCRCKRTNPQEMVSLQVSMVPLLWTLSAFLLNQLTVSAQRFETPANNTNHYGNLAESVDFVWTYTTNDISRTSITCIVNLVNIVFKRASAGATADIQGVFVGRATAIDDTTSSPYRFGFKLNNLAFSDANNYHCSMRYDGGPPIRSSVYRFKIYEKPRFSSCLTDGLSNGASYFYLREDGILNSTCYVYGSPVPTLDCRTYDYANNEQAKLPLVTRNYTSLPLTNRMLFNSVKRGVAKVKCVADGGVTGKISTERNVRVDYLPSAPRNIMLMESTPESIRIAWTAPQQPGVSPITDYFMELRHPNGTTTMTNYTVLNNNLEYTFSKLFANVKYGIRISAYNAIGMGEQSTLEEYTTVYFKRILAASSGNDREISNGTIFALIVVLPMVFILFIIVAVNVRKMIKKGATWTTVWVEFIPCLAEPEYPESYVEEDVDYNSGNDGLYARVNKAKSDNNFNTPTSGGPFVVHQGKTRRLRSNPSEDNE